MDWRRASFKGKKVWVAVGADGAPLASGGRVPMRYSDKPGAKVYGAGAGRIGDLEGPVVALDEGVSADAGTSGKRASRGSGFGSAGSRTKAQAAAAAEAAEALLASLPADTGVAFTDGSCRGNPGPAGSGAWLRLPDGRKAKACRDLGRATNNVAELDAVGLVLDLLDAADWPAAGPVALLSDSKYTHGVLSLGWKAKANRELILALRERLAARPGVELHWVAGHVGLDGNETADALANRGAAGVTEIVWTEA